MKATIGNKMQESFRGYECEVECTYRSSTTLPDANDEIETAIVESIQNAVPGSVDVSDFTDLVIEPDQGGERTDARNTRRRVRTFTVYAKEKA